MALNQRYRWICLILGFSVSLLEISAQSVPSNTDSTLSDRYFARGTLTADNRQYDSSKWYFAEARSLYEQEQNWNAYVNCQNELASLIMQIDDDQDSAISLLHFTLERTQGLFDTLPESVAITHDFLAGGYTNTGDYDKALYHDQKAIEVARLTLGEFDRRLAISHTNIANTYFGKKNYTKALEHCQQSLAINQQLERRHQQLEAMTYATMLNIYRETNDLQKVKEYTELNLIQFREAFGENTLTISSKYSDLVAGLLLLKDYPKALDYQRKSIRILENWPRRYYNNRRNAFTNMGNIFRHTGDYDSALYYLGKAWSIVEVQQQAHPNALAILNFKAYVHDSLGNYSLAEKEYKNQRLYLEKHFPTDTIRNASYYAKLGNHYRNIGQLPQALISYQHGLNMLVDQDVSADINALPSPELIANKQAAFNLMAEKSRALYQDLLYHPNTVNRDVTVRHLKAALSLLDQLKSEHPTDHSRIYMYQENRDLSLALVDCLIEQYEAGGAISLVEEALQYATLGQSLRLRESLNESKAQRFAGIPEAILDLEAVSRRNLTFYRQRLQRLTARVDATGDPRIKLWTEKIAKEQNRLDSLQNHFRKVYPEYFQLKYQDQTLPVAELQKNLKDGNHALINYVWKDSLLYAFVLTRDRINVEKISAPQDLSTRIQNFRQLIQNNQTKQVDAAAAFAQASHHLHEILMEPIMPYLEEIDQLTVIPDSWLSWIPFEVLISKSPEPGTGYRDLNYLIRNFTVSYAYSPDLWVSAIGQDAPSWEQQYTGFAPTYEYLALQESPELSVYGDLRDQLGPLKYAPQEITEANNFFSGPLFFDNNASEYQFKTLEGSSQILHLAMHALVDEENPWRSKMIFSQQADTTEDGFLHAYELYNLRLNAEMAVLSACNTGFGPLSEGEGVMSLSRAFSYAGCKSIVMSLWPAQDKSTLDIMTLFYQGLSEGLPKDQAMRAAKLQYLENSEDLFVSPFFWANFVVSGNAQPLTQTKPWVLYALWVLGLSLAMMAGYAYRKSITKFFGVPSTSS